MGVVKKLHNRLAASRLAAVCFLLRSVRHGMVWYGILEFNVPLDTV